jgi:hypothetical protein
VSTLAPSRAHGLGTGHGEARAPTGPIRALPAWAFTAACGVLYVFLAPPSPDLATAAYRSDLLEHAGFTLWDNSWYGGHHLLGYSLLAPALGALLSPQLLAAISMTASTALFSALIAHGFPTRAARLAALWFAFGATVSLLANRVAFDLGLALGLGALVAAQSAMLRPGGTAPGARRRRALALLLAVLCALASPVAGAFLALAALAWLLAGGDQNRWFQAGLMLAALAPIAVLTVAFPEGATEPFIASAFYPGFAGVLLIALLIPPERRVLRSGALLYAAMMLGAYVIPSAIGGNVARLGALLAGPIAACALIGGARWRALALIALAPFLIYWQAVAPVTDVISATSDPSVSASYYAPLLGELRARSIGYGSPARIEVVPTRDHWEARWIAPHVMIARGWERQLDTARNAIFYASAATLSPARYRTWLSAQAISYVALPNAPLDYSGRAEARLLAHPPGYLREVWQSKNWRLFKVLAATPLAQPPSVLSRVGGDSFTLRVPRAGSFTVRVRFTPYWALASGHGCVRSGPGGWTEVQSPGAGSLRVAIDFSPARIFDSGPRCR